MKHVLMQLQLQIKPCAGTLAKLKSTYCVDASIFPSGLKAAAIVDLGGGSKGQYLADKCSKDSASTLKIPT